MSQPDLTQAEVVTAYIAARAGVGAGSARHPELLARVEKAMVAAGTADAGKFCALLEHDSDRFDELVVALTVHESYFFRESPQIELLVRQVLPERAEARGAGGILRLWSAGCATGQEAYTLAILLDEQRLSGRARVLATDLSPQAIETARRGIYGKWSLRAVDDHRRGAYFRPVPGGFRVDPRLDRLITFHQHNLLDATNDPRMVDMDVVMCRNVLVYLNPDAVRDIGRRLAASLAPGGWLLTAATDPHLDSIEGLQVTMTPAGVAYRRVMDDSPGAVGSVQPRRQPQPQPQPRPRSHFPKSAPPQSRHSSARRVGASSTVSPAAPGHAGGTDPLEPARQALASGDYGLAAERAGALVASRRDVAAEAHVVLVQALGSAGRLAAAVAAAAEGAATFPLHVELRLLQAIVLLESGLPQEAAAAAKAALYVEPDLAMAHLTLARADQARQENEAACRSYRNALGLLEAVPADQPVRFADGETAGRLAGLARAGQAAQQLAARSVRS